MEGAGRKLFIETYGCQMNVGDTEIVVSLMQREGYVYTDRIGEADVILINTCSIRDNAEQRIWGRLAEMKRYRRANPGLVVGVIGCMAERLREKLVEGPAGVDVVAGPDAYRDLPRLVREAEAGGKGVNVLLSTEETYAEIAPVRLDRNGVSAFVAIMRGCDNFCSYCVVPYTRGRERSRDAETIVAEARSLFENGYREVTLLGQNVDSYGRDLDEDVDFADLIRSINAIPGDFVIRFMSSHPKDATEKLFRAMAECEKCAHQMHLPVQSGNDRVLHAMNRGYTREKYLAQVALARQYMPDLVLTTDIIVGFPGETDEEFQDTLSLVEAVRYDAMFTFIYSPRVGTPAAKMPDPYTRAQKQVRFDALVASANAISEQKHRAYEGSVQRVLVDGADGRGDYPLTARTKGGRLVHMRGDEALVGQFVDVKITGSNTWALYGEEA